MSELIDDDVWVCTDCYVDYHEGWPMKDNSVVTWTDNNTDQDGNDLTKDSSSTRCGCCGSTLAGVRFRMAVWE